MNADGHRIVATDVARLEVDLHDRRARADVAVVELGRELSQARADREDQVGPPARGGGLGRARASERTEIERMRVGDGVVSSVRRDHRDAVAVAQLNHQLVGAGAAGPAADEQQRTLGLPQVLHRLADRVRVRRLRMGDPVAAGRQRRRGRERSTEHVARDLDEHRALAAAHRRAQRAPQELGNALGLVDLKRLLGHRPEHAHQVVFLKRVLLIVVERDSADEHHHRRVGDVRRGDAGQQIGGARTARHEADARPIGDARQAIGHERGGLLVAHVDVFDARIVVERVQDVKERRADDSEYLPDTFGLQQLDDRSPTRPVVHDLVPPCTIPRAAYEFIAPAGRATGYRLVHRKQSGTAGRRTAR